MFKTDNIWFGLLIGVSLPLLLYGVFWFIWKIQNWYMTATLQESIQLLVIAIDGVVMRYFMITRDQEKTGKGILIVTFILAFIYVIYYHLN